MLSNDENTLYARQIILNNINLQGQYKLKKAKLLIVGAGGLGCPAIIYGATMGIGYIGIVDYDFINISNLNRQIIYNYTELNKQKIECIKNKILNTNPFCKVIKHSYKITQKNINEIFKYYDIIIDGTDNFESRYIIEKACITLHKIHVYGGVQQFEGQVALFNYQSNITYSDLYPKHLKLHDTQCNNGVLGATSGIISLLQLGEVIKVIIGIGLTIKSDMIIYNLLKYSMTKIRLYPKKLYTIHNDYNITLIKTQIDKDHIHQLYQQHQLIIIDIRDHFDFYSGHMKKSINIPLNLFMKTQVIKFIKSTFNNINLIIYCNSKERTNIASQILNQSYIKHYTVSKSKH